MPGNPSEPCGSTDVIDVLSRSVHPAKGIPGHIQLRQWAGVRHKADSRKWIGAVGAKTSRLHRARAVHGRPYSLLQLQLQAPRGRLLNEEIFYTLQRGQGDHRALELALQHRSPALFSSATDHPHQSLHTRAPGSAFTDQLRQALSLA